MIWLTINNFTRGLLLQGTPESSLPMGMTRILPSLNIWKITFFHGKLMENSVFPWPCSSSQTVSHYQREYPLNADPKRSDGPCHGTSFCRNSSSSRSSDSLTHDLGTDGQGGLDVEVLAMLIGWLLVYLPL